MPVVSSTRSSTTSGLPIVKSTPFTNADTLLSSIFQISKQSSSWLASLPIGETTTFPSISLPSMAVTMSGTHVVTIPSLSLTLSLRPTPLLRSPPSFSATSTQVPCDTENSSFAWAEFQGKNDLLSATEHSHHTTSSEKVVPTIHSTSTTTLAASIVTSNGNDYAQPGYSSTSQTPSTISHTTLLMTSTTTSPTPYSTLPSPSLIPERLSSTPGYSSASFPSVSQTPLTASSSAGNDSTIIIGSSVGAAAVFCSIAIVALFFYLRSRWRHSNDNPRLDPFVDKDSTLSRTNRDDKVKAWMDRHGHDQGQNRTPSESGVNATIAGANGPGSLPEIADLPSERRTPDPCATSSVVGMWPEEDRSAIARRTRSRELENIYPARHKCSGGISTRKRGQRGREKRGRRGNRGVDESEPHSKSRRKQAAASTKSETPTWSIRNYLTPLHWPTTLSREWTDEVMAQIGNVKVGTGVVVKGRTSSSSMEPSLRYSPSQNCSTAALHNNVSNDAHGAV